MSELKNTRKGKFKNEDESKVEKQDDEIVEKHCICDSSDYSTLMICCDYCSIWYHVKCVGIKKKDVDKIEKYACNLCKKNGKETAFKIQEENTKKRKESSEFQEKNLKIGDKPAKIIKKEESTVLAHTRSPSLAGSTLIKSKLENQLCKPKENNLITATKIKEEPPSNSIINERPPSCSTIIGEIVKPSSLLHLIPISVLKQQKIQEENPELRCENCIGCFRDKDCGKCVVCVQPQNKGKLCMQRICVQVEELLQKKLKMMEIAELSETSSLDCDVYNIKTKGRKSKHKSKELYDEITSRHRRSVLLDSPKEHDDVAIQLNKFYCNLMRKKTKTRFNTTHEVPKDNEEKQCIGPECVNSVRQGSKYCSERCGIALAQIRLKTILPQRFVDFFAQVPSKQTKDTKRLDDLQEQITQIHQKLKHLGDWKENVDNFLDAIKNAQPSAEQPRSEDDNLVVGCPVCGGEFPMRESTKHTQSCYARSEKQTTYGTDYPIPNNQYNLYCDAYNKINKTFCKRLRYACPEHYKDQYNLKICGCPLSWYKNGYSVNFEDLFLSSDAMIADGGYCQDKNKSCRAHQNWIQTSFSLIDNERMNLLNQLEEIMEQRAFLLKKLMERGDVIALLCNKSRRMNIEKKREDSKERDNSSNSELIY